MSDSNPPAPTLYERLGAAEGVATLASQIVDRHLVNPLIKARFLASDPDALKVLVRDFVSMGTGGPNEYEGRDMISSHTGLNINAEEFLAVIDDALAALDDLAVDAQTRMEFLAILYSFKGDIMAR